MAWLYLALAIGFEVSGTISLKLSDGLSKIEFAGLTVIAYIISFAFLGLCLRTIPVGGAYAIWAGIGTALIAVIGILWFDEPAGAARITCLGLIIIGVVGLHLLDSDAANAS